MLLWLFLTMVDETQVKIHCMSRELIGTVPVPSHLEVKLPATPAPLEPSSTHRCERSKARKLALNSGTTRRSAKNAQNAQKKPFIAPNSLKAYLSPLRTGMSTKSGDELYLRHCRKQTSLHDHRDVQNRRNSTCGTCEHLHNRGIDHVQTYSQFLASEPYGDCRCTTAGCERQCPASTGCNGICWTLHKRDIEHLVNGVQLGNLSGLLHGTKGNGL